MMCTSCTTVEDQRQKDSMVARACFGLQAVELQEQQHVRADALSGGMKRRLQVALALLGSSRVILLGTAL